MGKASLKFYSIMRYAIRILSRLLIAAFILGFSLQFVPGLLHVIFKIAIRNEIGVYERSIDSLDSVNQQLLHELDRLKTEISWLEDTHRNDIEQAKRLQQKNSELRIYLDDYRQQLADSTESLQFLRERISGLKRQAQQTAQQLAQSELRTAELQHQTNQLVQCLAQMETIVQTHTQKAAQYDVLERKLHLHQIGYALIVLLLGGFYLYASWQGWQLITEVADTGLPAEEQAEESFYEMEEDAFAS